MADRPRCLIHETVRPAYVSIYGTVKCTCERNPSNFVHHEEDLNKEES